MIPNELRTGILITGASGGLGAWLVAKALNLPDAEVIVATDINKNIVDQFSTYENVMGMVMDAGSEASIRQVREQLSKKRIRIKFLVNVAGVHAFFPITESTEELLDPIMRVNVYGPVLTVSVFLDDLIATKGRVIQVSSDSVRLHLPFYVYPASKMSMEALSISMRRELNHYGVRLIMVRPGAIQTNFLESMKNIKNEVKNSRYQKWFENFVLMSNKNIGKRSHPSEVAALIIQLLSVKNPRLIYSINKNRKLSFFGLFPSKWKDKLIARTVS